MSRGKDGVKKEMVSQIIASLKDKLLVNSPSDPSASFLAVLDGNRQNLQMDELVSWIYRRGHLSHSTLNMQPVIGLFCTWFATFSSTHVP